MVRWVRLVVTITAVLWLLIGAALPAHAIKDPFIVCVREPCGPIIVCVTEPCPGPGYPELPDLPDLP
jgi:hypothetical protein